jgi:hypothetical protein
MCNCLELKEFVVDLDSSWIDRTIPYQGRNIFPEFFEEIEGEEFEPELDYSENYYNCQECKQSWYFECTPDESTFPLFGIELSNPEQRLSQEEITSSKEFLAVLAHNGFEATKCRYAGCQNFKLKGKELCQKHLTVP